MSKLFQEIATATEKPKEVFAYNGPISHQIISELGDFTKIWLADNEKHSRKVFAIMIELMQNASYYSTESMAVKEDKKYGVGKFSISHDQHNFYLECTNLVTSEIAAKLDKTVEHINSLDHQALRKYKRQQRDTPPIEGSRGAGIGLIQVALLSNNPLRVQFSPHGENHFFYSNQIKVEKIKPDSSRK